MKRLNFSTTFVTSQRGAKSRTSLRQVLKRVQAEAEIIPNEPGQVMLLRDRASRKCLVDIFSEGPAGVMASLNLDNKILNWTKSILT